MKRLYQFLFGTLRGRLIIGVAAVHAVMMALFIGDLTGRQRDMLQERQIEEATALSHSLATSAAGWIAADDIAGLQELAEAQRRYPEILFAMLADRQGRVLADTGNSRQGLYLIDLPRETQQKVISSTPALVDVATPAMVGGRHVGWARVGIGQKEVGKKLAEITRNGIVYALAAILVGSVIAWFMGRRITKRLYTIQETIDAVRNGNRRARSQLTGVDEAAVMAREFNAMLDSLAERVMLAELSADIGCALTMPGDLRKMLNECAQALVHHLDAAFARIWTLNATDNILELQASTGIYTSIDGSHSRVPVGKFKIGLIAAERKPHVTNAVIGDPRVHDQEWAEREGMVAFAGHPLIIEDKLVGVMAMFSCNQFTDVTIKALASVSNEIAIGIERKRAEETLHLQAVELEQEIAERQVAQETLQDQAILLEYEIEERSNAQNELAKLNESLEQRVKKRTAELEQANVRLMELDRLKSMFIASMSHELRTPLNSVIGFSRILLNEWLGPLNGEQKENLDTVLRSGNHLLSLINDVIDVSKIEAGMIEVVHDDFDIYDLVLEAAKSFENDVGDKGVTLTVQAIHHSMHTDRTRLLQCLLNLVSNAVKYTETGTVTICVEVANDGGILEISVADTGIGIKEEDFCKLFSPFVRLDSHLASTVPGTGLGLYLTRKLAREVLQGDIAVTSSMGVGSQFVLTAPVNL